MSSGCDHNRVWLTAEPAISTSSNGCVERSVNRADYPLASDVVSNVPVYDGLEARSAATSPEGRKELMAEWVEALTDGPGVIAIRGAFADPTAIDRSNAHFWAIIEEERRNNVGGGDHFAKPGANDRVWNALEKLCLARPRGLRCLLRQSGHRARERSVARPGLSDHFAAQCRQSRGAAQVAHRDYHLGFQSAAGDRALSRPCPPSLAHADAAGAVAHCDMPLETGPTLYLPFSQSYLPGYMATGRAEFRDYFDTHHVHLPLAKGDAVFFNPALFHAAGTNRSKDVRRIANLLQVSSAFGRAMESVDRLKMSLRLYPALNGLLARRARSRRPRPTTRSRLHAEGDSFPTNLDRDPPKGGMAPKSQQDLMRQALQENWDPDVFVDEAEAQAWRKLT